MTNDADGPVRVFILALVAYNQETVIPAIELACAESNALYGPNIHFEYTVYLNPNPDTCDLFESTVIEFVADFYYTKRPRDSFFLLLATGCSYAMMNAGELSREWNVPMIASAGSDTKLRNKSRYPTLACFLPSQIVEYPRTFKRLLDRYQWQTVTFICDPDSSTDFYFKTACREFQGILRRPGQNYTVFDFETNLSLESSRACALTLAKSFSRVIVILAHMDLVRLTLITAFRMQMATPDFVFITSLLYNFNTPFWGDPHWFRNDSSAALNIMSKLAFRALLIVTMAKPKRDNMLKKFMDVIANASLQTYHSTTALAEEKQIYSICGHTAFRAAAEMVNETLATHRDLTDGAALVRRMYNRNFASVEGNPFKINGNGDRDSLCAVVALTTKDDSLEEVLYYDAHDRTMYPSADGDVWIREDNIAPDRAYCGYSGDDYKCATGINLLIHNTKTLSIAATLAAGVVLICMLCVTVLLVKRRRKRQANERSRWLLLAQDVRFDWIRRPSYCYSFVINASDPEIEKYKKTL